ncbi:IclR family transcriptional regulator [Extibacter muris]|uniref:IclR family transcriptional regulator n=1 Tax=Extibacter muris TaxID=1796622 RepID=UPI00242CC5D3|nr:catalase-related domain-containing protein [Extibacter muris]
MTGKSYRNAGCITQQGIKNLTDEEAELDLSGALYAYDPQDDPTDNCFRAGGDLWRVMTEDKRALLIENTARNIEPVSDNIKYRHAVHCHWADEAYGRRITEAMGLDMAKVEESRHKVSNTKSVSKTLAILSTFDETAPMQRTSDIAMKLDMNVSTVSRHLNTMLDWGFLERDDFTGFYYPGLEIVALAGAALQNNDVFRHAFPELQRLSYKYDVHGHMGIPRKTEVAHLISSSSERTMELFIPMGHRQPMYCSAMGRVLLAYMAPAKAEDILKNSNLQKRAFCLLLHDMQFYLQYIKHQFTL